MLILLSACSSGNDENAFLSKKIPTGLVVSAGTRVNDLSWSGVAGADYYTVYWSNMPGVTRFSGAAIKTEPPQLPNLKHSGLDNGQTYYYVVTSHTNTGESTESNEVSATPQAAPPPKPNITLAKSDDRQVTLVWPAVDGATDYVVYWDSKPELLKTGLMSKTNRMDEVISPVVHSNLTNGQAYFYVLVAKNEQGRSSVSDVARVVPQMRLPTAPLITLAELLPGNVTLSSTVRLSWQDVSNAESFDLFWNTTGNVSDKDSYLSQVNSPFTHVMLVDGQDYYYRIRAQNDAGVSVLSNEVKVSPPDGTILNPPGALAIVPAGITVGPHDGRLTLDWTADDSAKGYNIYWQQGPAGGVDYTSNKIKNVTPPFTHTGLTNGAVYFYKLSAINDNGESVLSANVSGSPEVIKPGVPAGVKAIAGDEWLTVRWNPVINAQAYILYLDNVEQPDPVTSPYTITGLNNGTTYTIEIEVQNGTNRGGRSKAVQITPQEPPTKAPTELVAKPSNGEIVLQWTAAQVQNPNDSVDEKVTVYRIYYGTRIGVTPSNGILIENEPIEISPGQWQFTHSGVTNGQIYYYVVTAVNVGGQSLASNEAWARPQVAIPGVPSGVWVKPGDNKVVIHFSPLPVAEGELPPIYNLYWRKQLVGTGLSAAQVITNILPGEIFTDGPDANGTTYVFQISAFNVGGEGIKSTAVKATPQVPPPQSSPQNVQARAQVGQVIITWDAVANATRYAIYWSTSANIDINSNARIDVSADQQAAGFTHSRLTNGQTYYYQIVAINPGGTSALSTLSFAQPQIPPPAAPTELIATAGDGRVTLNWVESATATSYRVYWRKETDAITQWNSLLGLQSGGSHLGLINTQSYVYHVTALNPGGESGMSNIVNATPSEPLPSVPTGLSAAAGNTQVSLNWHTVAGMKYTLYWNNDPTVAPVTSGNSLSDVRPIEAHTGLSNGKNYRYQVTANNSVGQSLASAIISATPVVPDVGAPQALSAEGGNKQVTLRWLPPLGATSATGYTLYWSTSTGQGTGGTAINGIVSPYVHKVLDNNQTYYYVVTATDTNNTESLASNEAMTQTLNPSADPTGLVVTPVLSPTISENLGTTTFTVALTSQPSNAANNAVVVFDIDSTPTEQVTTTPSPLAFTMQNWNIPQLVTITGINNDAVDLDRAVNINLAINKVATTDATYANLAAPAPVVVTVIDDEVPLSNLFTDPNLWKCIAKYVPANGNALDVVGEIFNIYNDAGDIVRTYNNVIICTNPDPTVVANGIIDLTGIEFLANIQQLWLWGHKITDVTPLKSMPNLIGLDLGNNNISSVSAVTGLSSLTNLKHLWLYENKLGNSVGVLLTPVVPMQGAPTGVTATPDNGQVTLNWNVPAGVTVSYNLSWEDIDPFANNRVANSGKLIGRASNVTPPFTATNLTNWETYNFYLTEEKIGVAGGGDSKLTTTVFALPKPSAPNTAQVVSVQNGNTEAIVNWEINPGATYTIRIWDEAGVELPRILTATPGQQITGLTNGQTYYLRIEEDKTISSIDTLNNLVNLTELELAGNYLNENDLSSFSALGVLSELYLKHNEIVDITEITSRSRYRSQLSGLELDYNHINTINSFGAVGFSPNLSWLSLYANNITDISPLSGKFPGLTTLYLGRNKINDLAALKTHTALQLLGLSDNQLGDSGSISSSARNPIAGEVANVMAISKDNEVRLSWDAPNGGTAPFTYHVTWRSTSYPEDNGYLNNVALPTAAQPIPIRGLKNREEYLFEITAIDTAATTTTVATTITPQAVAPGAPSEISAVASNGQISVTWTNAQNGGTGYAIQRIKRTPGVSQIVTEPATSIIPGPGVNQSTFVGTYANNTSETFIISTQDAAGTALQPLLGLNNLQQLWLTQNYISDFSVLASSSNSMTYLNIAENFATDISALTNFTLLTEFRAQANAIVDISSMSSMTALVNTDLHGNNISDMTPVLQLTNLSQLILGRNNLNSLGVNGAIWNLPNLTELYLYRNNITDLSTLPSLPNLRILGLSSNKIADVSNLTGANYPILNTLRLDNNAVSNLLGTSAALNLPNIGSITTLTYLDLSTNNTTPLLPVDSLSGFNSNRGTIRLLNNDKMSCAQLQKLQNSYPLYLILPSGFVSGTDCTAQRIADILNPPNQQPSIITDASLRNCIARLANGNPGVPGSQLTIVPELTDLSCNSPTIDGSILDVTGIEVFYNIQKASFQIDNQRTTNNISEMLPLSLLPSLEQLFLNNNSVQDITPIVSFPRLAILELKNNSISDASLTNLMLVIKKLNTVSNLANLGLGNQPSFCMSPTKICNNITDLNMFSTLNANLEIYFQSLTYINFGSNSVVDLSALGLLPALEVIEAYDNLIDNSSIVAFNQKNPGVPANSFPSLRALLLPGNQIDDVADIAIGQSGKLGWLYLNNNALGSNTNSFQPAGSTGGGSIELLVGAAEPNNNVLGRGFPVLQIENNPAVPCDKLQSILDYYNTAVPPPPSLTVLLPKTAISPGDCTATPLP